MVDVESKIKYSYRLLICVCLSRILLHPITDKKNSHWPGRPNACEKDLKSLGKLFIQGLRILNNSPDVITIHSGV